MTRQVVRQRNATTIQKWSAYASAEAIPATPDDAWIRLRVLAEGIPMSIDMYTQQTLTYFAQDPGTQTNILQFISEDNDDSIEDTLATTNDSIISGFAQRWADAVINDQQVANWRTRNNYPPTKH
jgi:hypothetical protein